MPNIVVGNKYRFDTKGSDSSLKALDGETCTVLRSLPSDEADIRLKWRIRFDGKKRIETDAFDDELYGPYREKITLMDGSNANSMITDLQYGGYTHDGGDRMSQYFNFATVPHRSSFVKIALIEDKVGQVPRDYGYRLHVLNDIDGLDGYFLSTDHLDANELSQLLDDLAFDAAHGRA